MSNWLKRSLSFLLTLVMVLGLMPTNLSVRAAEEIEEENYFEEADGIVWLTKGEDGDVSAAFQNLVLGEYFDNVIREAVGLPENAETTQVIYESVDIGNSWALATNWDTLQSLEDEMRGSNKEPITFNVGGEVKKVVFRSLEGVQVNVGTGTGEDVNKIYIDSDSAPADADVLKSWVETAINNAAVRVIHNGTVEGANIYADTKARYEGVGFELDSNEKWPSVTEEEFVDTNVNQVGTLYVTIYGAEYKYVEEGQSNYMKTFPVEVYLRDTKPRATVTFNAVAMNGDEKVQDGELKGYSYSYRAYVGDTIQWNNPTLYNYTISKWLDRAGKEITDFGTLNTDVEFTAVMVANNDNNENGIADENEKYTITYKYENGSEDVIDVTYGDFTPEVDDPTAPSGMVFNGWMGLDEDGEATLYWQPVVYRDMTYVPTWIEEDTSGGQVEQGPAIKGNLKIRGEIVSTTILDTSYINSETNEYIVKENGWEQVSTDGYNVTGWYYVVPEGSDGAQDLNQDSVYEEVPVTMYAENDDYTILNKDVELFYELYTLDEDGYPVGSQYSPLYIYEFATADGSVKLQLGSPIEEEPPYVTTSKYQRFNGWDYQQLESKGEYVYRYKVTANLTEIKNGYAFSSYVAGWEDTLDTELRGDGKLYFTWGKTETATTYYGADIKISGMTQEGENIYNFIYDKDTQIAVSPIWQYVNGEKSAVIAYVNDVTVIEEGRAIDYVQDDSIVGSYDSEYYAYNMTGYSGENITLYIDYVPVKFELLERESELILDAGKDYTAEYIYDELMNTNISYSGNEDAIAVEYLAREKNDSVSVKLYKMYELFEAEGLGVLMDMAGSLPESYPISLREKWLNVESSSEEMTAQEVADSYLTDAYNKQKEDKFSDIVKFFVNLVGELEKTIGENAVHQFGYVNFGADTSVENLKITYTVKSEDMVKFSAVVNKEITVQDNRIRTKFTENPDDITTLYNDSVAEKVLANVTLTTADGGDIPEEDLVGAVFVTNDDGSSRDYSVAGTGEYNNVTVTFKGNEKYRPAVSDSFKLTVEKVEPVVNVEELIAVLKGTDYYSRAAVAVEPNAPIVQIIAGVSADEFKLDENLALADDEIVIDAWVKLPQTYIELLDGLELGTFNGIVDGVELPSKTIKVGTYYEKEHLEVELEKYAADTTKEGAKQIQQILDILDKIPDKVLNRLGVNDLNYTLRIRLDALEDNVYPTDSGFYVNYAATLSTFTELAGSVDKNYGTSDDYGFIVISPMVPIPNRGGVQLYDGEISNAQNVFVYEYDGVAIERELEVAINDVKQEGETPFYYGLTTRFNATNVAPSVPGVYFAGYNYTTTVPNEDTGVDEVRRLGSDSAIIIIKQREADMEIKGGTYEYDEKNHIAEVIVTDKDGKELKDAAVTVISGTVNTNAEGTNVSANDLYGAVNVDFPDALQDKWDAFCNEVWGSNAPNKITPSDVISFLEDCANEAEKAANKAIEEFKSLAINETVSAALDKINGKQDKVDVSSGNLVNKAERVQDLMQGGRAYFDKLIEQLKPLKDLDDNVWITFYDLATESAQLDYSKTGYYLYLGVITDPDLTVGAGKGLVIIHSEDDYIMYDKHVPYNGKPQNIFVDDDTTRGDVTVMVDRNKNEIKFFLDSDMYKAINKALSTILNKDEDIINDGSDVVVGTVYTKAENIADAVSAKIVEVIKEKAISRIEDEHPAGSDKLKEALDKLEDKIGNLTDRVSSKLQELDKMPNDTRIVVYNKTDANDLQGMPVNAGTYEFYGYDYDVSATRGKLVIEPIYILVEDGTASKYVGEDDPDLKTTVTVTYYSYEGIAPEAVEQVNITQLPAGITEAVLVSYEVTRTEGEEIGKYNMTVTATLLNDSGNYVLAERTEDGEDFEILPEIGTIGLGEWRMDLDSVVYLHYYPTLEGFSEGFDFSDEERAGVVIWTGEEAPTSRNQLMVGKDNTMVIKGWKWNEDTEEWFVRTHEIYAKNLGDMVYIRPYVVNHEGEYVYLEGAPYYSPQRFAYDVMDVESEPDGKQNVCAALLQYGASAQVYFNYETENLVTTIPVIPDKPEKYKYIDWSDYASAMEYKDGYKDDLMTDDHVRELAATLAGRGENNKVGVVYVDSTLDLAGAIRLSTGFDIDSAIIDDLDKIVKAEVLFWNERDFDKIDSLEYKYHNYNFKYDLVKATGEETVDIGDYRAQSDHIVAKYLSESVYFTCRIEMEDGTVYNSGLGYYSPEAFAGDYIDNNVDDREDEVCKRIVVYSEMAKQWFLGNNQ